MAVLVGIDPASDGLAFARKLGVPATAEGIGGLVKARDFDEIPIVFDATSAKAHHRHEAVLRPYGKQVIDLTPAAIGPYVVPAVNMREHLEAPNLNMVSCGGQATIPIVAAVNRVARVLYGEIVSSIASKSAGPGTRANIDEFTQTTARAVERVGGADSGKAIIILNPAEPPLVMRNTVFCMTADADTNAGERSVESMCAEVRGYVPGYRLKQSVQFDRLGDDCSIGIHGMGKFRGIKTSVYLEVEGAGHYLPKYAGNLGRTTHGRVTGRGDRRKGTLNERRLYI